MTERYDAIECEMGISTYAAPDHEGFAGVSKARYSDFVVHEGKQRAQEGIQYGSRARFSEKH